MKNLLSKNAIFGLVVTGEHMANFIKNETIRKFVLAGFNLSQRLLDVNDLRIAQRICLEASQLAVEQLILEGMTPIKIVMEVSASKLNGEVVAVINKYAGYDVMPEVLMELDMFDPTAPDTETLVPVCSPAVDKTMEGFKSELKSLSQNAVGLTEAQIEELLQKEDTK